MFRLNQLLQIIKAENILLEYSDIVPSIQGTFYMLDDLKIIIINNNIVDNSALHKSVIAEELGHYYTSTRKNIPYQSTSYSEQISIDKEELRALRWAADFLMPTDELIEDINSVGFSSYDDLCEIYDVTPQLAKTKIEHMAAIKSYWDLGDDLDLVLSNLPSIYIFKRLSL